MVQRSSERSEKVAGLCGVVCGCARLIRCRMARGVARRCGIVWGGLKLCGRFAVVPSSVSWCGVTIGGAWVVLSDVM